MSNPAHGLGSYMRELAKRLTEEPQQLGLLMQGIRMPGTPAAQVGYAITTMLRLVERGIAEEVDVVGGFYRRGPRWPEAAQWYGWE